MSTRRSFLGSLFAAVALSPFLCRLTTESIQPELSEAPLTQATLDRIYQELIAEAGIPNARLARPSVWSIDPNPPRFNLVDGQFVRVTP